VPTAEALSEFFTIVAGLLIMLDPLGLLPILIAAAASDEKRQHYRLAFKVVGGGTVLILFFTLTGTWILNLFGVTLNDLRIGGGLLLLIIALRMVLEGRMVSGQNGEPDYSAAIAPLISPFLVGPGTITASVVLAAIHGVWMTVGAALVAMLVCLLFFLSAGFFHKLVGRAGADLITRIMGVLIAAIAVSYIRSGIIDVLSFTTRQKGYSNYT